MIGHIRAFFHTQEIIAALEKENDDLRTERHSLLSRNETLAKALRSVGSVVSEAMINKVIKP